MKPILQVRPGDSLGRYFVQGRSLTCVGNHTHESGKLSAGDPCPTCTDPLFHPEYLCDVTLYTGLGKCGCAHWTYNIQPLLGKMSPDHRFVVRESSEYRCQHLQSAILYFGMQVIDQINAKKTPANRKDEGE